jgi:hypothetical protein
MSGDSKIRRQTKAARKIMKKRRKALAALAGKTPDPKFEATMKHADEVMRRYANAYKELAKR